MSKEMARSLALYYSELAKIPLLELFKRSEYLLIVN